MGAEVVVASQDALAVVDCVRGRAWFIGGCHYTAALVSPGIWPRDGLSRRRLQEVYLGVLLAKANDRDVDTTSGNRTAWSFSGVSLLSTCSPLAAFYKVY